MLGSVPIPTTLLALCVFKFGYHVRVSAYSPGSGSSASGDLSASAPYGISPDKFKSDTSKPDASAAFNITGYDISSDASPAAASGWKLAVGVKDDVSLSDAADSSVSKDQTFEASTLYVAPPSGMKLDDTWRICAVVYPGVSSSVSNSTTVDGTCNNVLSSECIQALTSTVGGSASAGIDNDGNCTNFRLPARCESAFPTASINNTAITMNQTILDNERFYAYGSDATVSGNTTAQDEAVENVWPVIMIFGHLSGSGALSSSNIGVQCVRAQDGTTKDDLTSGATTSRPLLGSLTAYSTTVTVAVLLSGWLLTFELCVCLGPDMF